MGYGDEVLTLIQARTITNEFGYPTTIQEQRRGVYAQLRSAGRSEFYQARAAGVEIEMIAIIRAEDYAMEREAELYGDIRFSASIDSFFTGSTILREYSADSLDRKSVV